MIRFFMMVLFFAPLFSKANISGQSKKNISSKTHKISNLSSHASEFKSKFLDSELKSLKSKIDQTLVSNIAINIDIQSFDVDYANGSVLADAGAIKGFKNNCFTPLFSVIKEMSENNNLKYNLKKIEISNVNSKDTMFGFASFKNKTLLFRAPATTNTSGPYADKIQSVLQEAIENYSK